MAKLIDLMRQAGVQWPDGAEYAAQDGDDCPMVAFYHQAPELCAPGSDVWGHKGQVEDSPAVILGERADDWMTPTTREQWFDSQPLSSNHTSPDEQQRLAARNTERIRLVCELMLRHPELNGQQAIAQADLILSTLEGLK